MALADMARTRGLCLNGSMKHALPIPRPYRGIVPPLATPLLTPNELDAGSLERLTEHVLAGGVHGLFVLGTTGEGTSLSVRMKKEIVQRVCALAAGRAPVLVCITDPSAEEAVELAEWSAEAGASAVVTAPPYYVPLSQPELLDFLGRLAPRLPLPLFLYNIPGFTKTAYEPETVRAAAGIPGIIGLKDSSGSLAYFKAVAHAMHDRPDFSLLMGPELLLAESMAAGGHGGVTGGANLFPALFVRLFDALMAGDAASVLACQGRVKALGRLYGVSPEASGYLRGLKCALAGRGLCRNILAEPFTPFSGKEEASVRQCLEELHDVMS